MTMRLPAVLSLLLSLTLGAQADDQLAGLDALTRFEGDLQARYTVVHQDAQGGQDKRVAQVARRDRTGQFTVVTLAPASSAGKSYLRDGDSLWFYDPRDHQFTLTSARERFAASDLRLSDFSGSAWAADYRIAATRQAVLGRFACTVYSLEALRDDVLFPHSEVWVSEDRLVRKVVDAALSGDVVRRVLTPSWQRVGDRWLPAKVLITDVLRGEETQITVDQVTQARLDDAVFSKAYLERAR